MTPLLRNLLLIGGGIVLATLAWDFDRYMAGRIAALPVHGGALDNRAAAPVATTTPTAEPLVALEVRPGSEGDATDPTAPSAEALSALFIPPARPVVAASRPSPEPTPVYRPSPAERLPTLIRLDALMPPGAILNGAYVHAGGTLPVVGIGDVTLARVTQTGAVLAVDGSEVSISLRKAQ